MLNEVYSHFCTFPLGFHHSVVFYVYNSYLPGLYSSVDLILHLPLKRSSDLHFRFYGYFDIYFYFSKTGSRYVDLTVLQLAV